MLCVVSYYGVMLRFCIVGVMLCVMLWWYVVVLCVSCCGVCCGDLL